MPNAQAFMIPYGGRLVFEIQSEDESNSSKAVMNIHLKNAEKCQKGKKIY